MPSDPLMEALHCRVPLHLLGHKGLQTVPTVRVALRLGRPTLTLDLMLALPLTLVRTGAPDLTLAPPL